MHELKYLNFSKYQLLSRVFYMSNLSFNAMDLSRSLYRVYTFLVDASCSTAAKDQREISPFPQNSFACLSNVAVVVALE